MRRLWIALLLLLAVGGTARGGDAPNGDVPWPVAKEGAEAIYRAVLAFDLDLAGMGHVEVHLTTEHAQQVVAGGPLEVRVTQGRLWGGLTRRVGERSESLVSFVQDNLFLLGCRRGASACTRMGGSVVRRVDADAAAVSQDASTGRIVEGLAIPDLALPIRPPAAAVRVGTAWDGSVPLVVMVAGPIQAISAAARHTVSGVDADSITLRSEGTLDRLTTDPALPWSIGFHFERRFSRVDGLLREGVMKWDATGRTPSTPGAQGSARFARVPPAEPPSGVAEAERAAMEFASGGVAARRAAASSLASIWPHGARALPMLVAALDDEETSVRRASADAIEKLGARAIGVAVAFIDALGPDDSSGFLGVGVTSLFGQSPDLTPAELAAAVLTYPVGGALAAALVNRGGAADRGRAAREAMLPLLDRATYRQCAGMELWDPRAVELASAGLALLGLGRLPPSATRPVPKELVSLAGHSDLFFRWFAVRMLDRLGSVDSAALAALRSAVASTSVGREPSLLWKEFLDGSAAAGTQALNRLEGARFESAATRDEVIAALRAPAPPDPRPALDVLARIGANSAPAVPALVFWLNSATPEDALWGAVVRALGRIGTAATPALPLLARFSRHVDPMPKPRPPTLPAVVAAGAAARIDRLTPDRLVVLLDAIVLPVQQGDDRDPFKTPQATVEATLAALGDLLGRMGAPERAQTSLTLARALGRDDLEFVRERMVGCLARTETESPAAVRALITALEKARTAFGAGAAESSPGQPRDLASELRESGASFVGPWSARYAIVEALGAVGGKDPAAVAALEPLTRSDDLLLRYLANRALRRLRGS